MSSWSPVPGRRWAAGLVLALVQEGALPRETPAIQLGGGTPGGVSGARDLTGEGTAFLEVVPDREAVLVEQPVHLAIRVGLAEDFADQHLVQLFQRALDLPVQVDLSSLDELPAVRSAGPAAPEHGVTLAVDEAVIRVPVPEIVERDGRRYRVVTLERTLRPTLPGTIRVPAATLRFAYTTRFQEDVFQGRVATDRIDARVRSRPVEITVAPWPEAGRPPGFGGAVGDLAVRASADPRDLVLGQSLQLVLTFTGEGNLDRFEAPRLDDLAGFAVLGMLDEPAAEARTITYDLSPRSDDVTEIPAIAFPVLDPGPPPAYRTRETQPIPILVRPAPEASRPPAPTGTAAPQSDGGRPWIPVLLVALVMGVAAYVVRRARRSARSS